ncbi:MAG: MvaI/BcnI restriction endonuclease family protein [Bacilli bacterium]|nr:MvaI/BcnI restriction endonuclease family protein [Bacilli bacterium]
MNENFENLIEKFKVIARKRWIKGVTKGYGNVGLTFENELGKKIDTNYTPDYKNIEIKSTTRFSRFPISLFSIALDGPTDKEIIRLNETYGKNDKDFPDKKILFEKIKVNEQQESNKNYLFSFLIKENKLYLQIYDKNKNLIEQEAYIYLDNIKKHVLTKLNNFAIIKASKKKIDGIEYFRYYQITLYTLKSFKIFIDLLQKGKIEIFLVSRMQKSGTYVGRYRNKNLVFQIKKQNISELFNQIYTYNYDDKNNQN